MYRFNKWTPNEKEISTLLPIVGSREKAIDCLRALEKRRRDEIRGSQQGGGQAYVHENKEGENL